MSYSLFISRIQSLFLASLLIFTSIGFAIKTTLSFETEVQSINELIQQEDFTRAQAALEAFWSAHQSDNGFVDAVRRVKDAYWTEGNYDEHFVLCERIVTALPNDPLSIGIQVDQVTGYIKLKDMSRASNKLQQFWARYSSDERFVDFARRIKDQYWWSGYYTEHFALCERLVEEFPNDPLAMSIWADDITGYIRTQNPQRAGEKLEEFWSGYSAKSDFTTHLRTIREVYRFKGYTDEHEALCARIIQEFPNDPVTLEILADRISGTIHAKNTAKASEDLDQFWTAHKTDQGFVNAVRRVKDQYWTDGYHPEHFALCERIVNEFPNDPLSMGIQIDQVTGYIKLNDMTRAKEELRQFWAGYRSKEGFAERAHSLGWDFLVRKDYNTALQIYGDLKTQFPDHERAPWFQRSIIQCYMGNGDKESLAAAVNELKTNYKNCDDYLNQMEITAGRLTDKEEYELAKEICDSLLQQYPDSARKIWFIQYKIRADLGKKDDTSADAAVALIHQQYAQNKDYHDALSWAAYEYRTYGYYDKAIAMYQDLYAKNPNDKVKLRCDEGIARSYLWLGNDTKVREQINRIYENYAADNPEGVGFYMYAIGEQYYLMGQKAEREGDTVAAQAAYTKAIDVWQDHLTRLPEQKGSECAYLSAIAFQQMNDYEQAIRHYQQVVEQWPHYERAWNAQYQIACCYDQMCNKGIISRAEAREMILPVCQRMEAFHSKSPAMGGVQILREKYNPGSVN